MKLTDKIHLLQIDFEIEISQLKKVPRFVNVILILGDKITVIDTGVKGSEQIIFNYLEEQGRNASEIERVILSHAHPDHIGSAYKMKELTGCKVCAHQLEKEWIENIELQSKQRPVPGFFRLVDQGVKVDQVISDNETITIQNGLTLRCIKSSGHSKGMLNILFVEDKIEFTADSIPLKNDIPNYENFVELMKSLDRIKNHARFDILLTSWTPPLCNKNEIKQLIREGEEYMKQINSAVLACYPDKNTSTLDSCKRTVEMLGLPGFLINPIVDKAFKSHFRSF